jgi:RimJ/RimL family protein N-acetyltransferase
VSHAKGRGNKPVGQQAGILNSGKRVVLRDRLPSDVEHYLRWQTSGEWRFYDPWEEPRTSVTAHEASEFRDRFLRGCEQGTNPTPRDHATIASPENEAFGFVNRYSKEGFPDTWYVGISICEDSYLNRGLGTDALRLWVQHLFSNPQIHRLGLDTWSNNPRMIRAAQKAGFVYEGEEREILLWHGQRLNLVHLSILRPDWEGNQG